MKLLSNRDDERSRAASDVALIERISAVPVILQILCDTTGLGFGAVARVDGRSWTVCATLDRAGYGFKPGEQRDATTTLCREVHANRTPIVIEKASEDPLYRGHHTPRLFGFESYVSVPIIRSSGDVFGAICAFDPKPVTLSGAQLLPTLQLFAELIATQIEVEERLELTRSALDDANAAGVLREQFVAVLGHDLRNPLAAVSGGLDWLSQRALDQRATVVVGQMRQSCRRISELVDNVMDFARGKLGGGIPVDRRDVTDLATVLLQVVQELMAAHPHRRIDVDLDTPVPVFCDPPRIGQLLSNLLANALIHGAPEHPVQVSASSDADRFRLSVGNRGNPIAPSIMASLFQPFSRAPAEANPAEADPAEADPAEADPAEAGPGGLAPGDAVPGGAMAGGVVSGGVVSGGLGLGLYIASEIARAHDGTLDVSSSGDGTVFLLTLPMVHQRRLSSAPEQQRQAQAADPRTP